LRRGHIQTTLFGLKCIVTLHRYRRKERRKERSKERRKEEEGRRNERTKEGGRRRYRMMAFDGVWFAVLL